MHSASLSLTLLIGHLLEGVPDEGCSGHGDLLSRGVHVTSRHVARVFLGGVQGCVGVDTFEFLSMIIR